MRHVSSSPRRRLPKIIGLGISAIALVGLVQLQSVWAQADRDAEDRTEDLTEAVERAPEAPAAVANSAAVPAKAAPVAAVPAKVEVEAKAEATPMIAKAEVTTEALADSSAVATVEAEILPDTPALIAMPDLKGKGLRKVRRQLKALGLKMVARDGSYRLSRHDYEFYKVRKQNIEPGTMVEPGTRVKIKARERRMAFGQGY